MDIVHLSYFIIGVICLLQESKVFGAYVNVTNDGPVMLDSLITFKADLYEYNGKRPTGIFKYIWSDNTPNFNRYESEDTSNTTSCWTVNYPRTDNIAGSYIVSLTVMKLRFKIFHKYYQFAWNNDTYEITNQLNGNLSVVQLNKTIENKYVSSTNEIKIVVNIRESDYNYIKNKSANILVYWFIDCKYHGKTNDFTFVYNATKPDTSHMLDALIIASYDQLTTTTSAPLITTTALPSNATAKQNSSVPNINSTVVSTLLMTSSTPKLQITTETTIKNDELFTNIEDFTFPFICSNSSIIPMDPNKTYGSFRNEIFVRAPITNITVEGTPWIQPWDMLSLNVTFKGSAPFYKCLRFSRGVYNVTGNETCNDGVKFNSRNFSIKHYFLEPGVSTILVILSNDISTQIYPLTINTYKVTKKAQLSVIIVPVSCTLIAVVLVVFGIAYYIQSRARFIIEVADFDFGQNNPEMEYKTFRERLRDSFNNAVASGNKRISVRPPYYGSMS